MGVWCVGCSLQNLCDCGRDGARPSLNAPLAQYLRSYGRAVLRWGRRTGGLTCPKAPKTLPTKSSWKNDPSEVQMMIQVMPE